MSGGMDRRPRVVVVGGTGHIGAALSVFLSGRGHSVTAISRSANLAFASPEISHQSLDVCSPIATGCLPPSDIAIICPWINALEAAKSPSWIEHLLQRLVEAGTRSVLYLSTVWVYGDNPEGLLTESTVGAPSSPYGAAHLENESTLLRCAGDLHLDVSILRMANLVGADLFFRARTKIAFGHELMGMALDDQSIILKSPPSTPRNFLTRSLFHHDLLPLLDRCASEGRVEIFNLGGGSTSTVIEFARRVATLVGRRSGTPVRVEYQSEPTPQVPFHLDSTRIRSLAGPGIDDLDLELSLVWEDVVASRVRAGDMGGPG